MKQLPEKQKANLWLERRSPLGWDALDDAARANLNSQDLQRFFTYKNLLKSEGVKFDDAECILTGFIWDATEDQTEDLE